MKVLVVVGNYFWDWDWVFGFSRGFNGSMGGGCLHCFLSFHHHGNVILRSVMKGFVRHLTREREREKSFIYLMSSWQG